MLFRSETVSLETNITSKESTSIHTPTPNQTTITRKEQIINQGQLNEDTAVTEEEDAIQSEIDCKQQSLGSSSSITKTSRVEMKTLQQK